jgi:hypothetical protein
METMFYVSYAMLWILFAVSAVLLFLLYRHVGIAILGTAEGIQRDGLGIGEEAPTIFGITSNDQHSRWLPQLGRPQLLVFASPTCEPCAEISPYLERLSRAGAHIQAPAVTAIVAGSSEQARQAEAKFESSFSILADDGTGTFDRFRIRVTPFAFVIGADGRVYSKGPCGHPDALKHLLTSGGVGDAAVLLDPSVEIISMVVDGSDNGRTVVQ